MAFKEFWSEFRCLALETTTPSVVEVFLTWSIRSVLSLSTVTESKVEILMNAEINLFLSLLFNLSLKLDDWDSDLKSILFSTVIIIKSSLWKLSIESHTSFMLISFWSNRYINIFALFTLSFALATPINSIWSSVSLRPAVSINLNCIPSMVRVSSTASLVVPGIEETIARSSFNKALSKEDFPALGLPAITTGTPFFITLPYWNESINDLIFSFKSLSNLFNAFLSAKSTSSSEKSSSRVIKDAKSSSCCLSIAIWWV